MSSIFERFWASFRILESLFNFFLQLIGNSLQVDLRWNVASGHPEVAPVRRRRVGVRGAQLAGIRQLQSGPQSHPQDGRSPRRPQALS